MSVSIRKMSDRDCKISCKQFSFIDADADFREAFENKENLFSICNENNLVGAALIHEGEKPFLSLYVDSPYRGKGIGGMAFSVCEQILQDAKAEIILTSYRTDNGVSKLFAEKRGFKRNFSSTFMKYNGVRFDIPVLPIREYKDDDYDSAYEMYSKAFHEMRIRVGDFPDSVIGQPNSTMREQWELTKKERLVYLHGDEIVGYSHVVGNEVASISVKSQYQGKGIGRMFMKFIINRLLEDGNKTVSLYCVVGNWAKRLYDSLGFADEYTVEYASKSVHSK